MKQRWIALLAALLILTAGCGTPAPASSSGTTGSSSTPATAATPMQADLQLFSETLQKQHKNLFANITREQWQAEVAAVEAKLPEMSEGDFYYALRHLLSLVGDSHTSLSFSEYGLHYRYLRALPFAVVLYEDGWHLGITEPAASDKLGWLVTAINGTPMDEVMQKAKSIISFDNDVWVAQQLSNTINFLEALQYLGIAPADADSVTLTVQKDAASPAESLVCKALSESEVGAINFARLQPNKVPLTAPNGYYSAELLDDKTLFLQYNTCTEDPKYPMSRFAQEVSEALEEAKPSRVIVDLRYNSGGDSSIFNPMTKALKKQKAAIGFQVYTLIGSDTFSSGIINAVDTQQELDATLVGSATGSSVNHYGELQSFALQTGPISVYYSTKYFELLPDYAGDSLLPDVAVAHTFADYMNGVDAEVTALLAQK